MHNIKLTVEYDGSRYRGWAKPNTNTGTLSAKFLSVINKMSGETPELHCGCRTEAGVHAYHQVISFQTAFDMDLEEIKSYFNRYLPMDIVVLDIQEMPERFHATLNVTSIEYQYHIQYHDIPNLFTRKYTYIPSKALDVSAMQQAAMLMRGPHDFSAFTNTKKKKTRREIQQLRISSPKEGTLVITLRANHFLHHMARRIIGTLLDIGLGNAPCDLVARIFAGEALAGKPCDPKALFLTDITYPDLFHIEKPNRQS